MRLCIGREPQADEVQRVLEFYDAQLKRFHDKSADPQLVALAPNAPPPKDLDLPQLAAWTMVCRSTLNLDETFTKD